MELNPLTTKFALFGYPRQTGEEVGYSINHLQGKLKLISLLFYNLYYD